MSNDNQTTNNGQQPQNGQNRATSDNNNGWRPRFKVRDEVKDGVLDFQKDIMSKFYPTKESREKERQEAAGGDSASVSQSYFLEEDTDSEEVAADVSAAADETASRKDSTEGLYDDLSSSTAEVYTRLKPQKPRDDFGDRPKRTYRPMPGSSRSEERQGESGPKRLPEGLGRMVEADATGAIVTSTEEAPSEKIVEDKEKTVPPVSEAPVTPAKEEKPRTNIAAELDRLFSDTKSSSKIVSPLKRQQEMKKETVVTTVPEASTPEATVPEPVSLPEAEPVTAEISMAEGMLTEEPAEEPSVEETPLVTPVISSEAPLEVPLEVPLDTPSVVSTITPPEEEVPAVSEETSDEAAMERISIPVVDVMADTNINVQVPQFSSEEKKNKTESTATSVAAAVGSVFSDTVEPKKVRRAAVPPTVEENKEDLPEETAEETPKNKKVFTRLLRMIAPHSIFILVSLVATVISVGLQLYAPYLFGVCIDYAVGQGAVDMDAIMQILIRLLVVVGITVVAQWVLEVCNNRVTFRVIKDIRCKAFDHLQQLPLRFIDSKKHGELVNCVMTDVDQISDGLLLGFTQLFSGIVMIIGTLIFMIIVDWRVTIGVVVLTPVSLIVASQIANRTFHMFQEQSENRAQLAAHVEEMIGNQKVVIAFGHESNSIADFDDLNDQLAISSRKATFYSSITNPATRFVNSLVYAFVGIIGAIFGIQGSFSIGDLTCFLSYAKQYTKPFNEISGVIAEFQNALASAGRVFDLLDEPIEEPDTSGASQLAVANGNVALRHVNFSYLRERPLIRDFNLDVQPGQRVAIVGPTGCGKTTLINLLMRFYDVNSGEIIISNRSIKNITRDSLRNQFGMVLQDTWIRSGTIYENIAYGKPDATKEQVIAAAKAVHAHSFIRRLPQGYDTVLSEDGGNLSQGQKQLLCIARVMLKLPPMLILDEATSSIDTRTEIKIQRAFAEMMKGRTSFVVAHRLSTIQESDIILVMKDGNVIEQGTHEELLAKNGFYSELYYSQYALS